MAVVLAHARLSSRSPLPAGSRGRLPRADRLVRASAQRVPVARHCALVAERL
ncbi:hypothetical protein HMPREF0682_2212 [Propionibacterium acidifaciens F0233]|uniref:Uncharacterized protein n=1 Tax=Propionibacterium acidifaciens F0233 TaxID=553198 RepID=U2QBJ6_9ACTN|nr:hypothetical protein HMPREF0682_2212 [Propionibacterium acidifaciens F0233]